MLVADGEAGQVVSAATGREQAKIVFSGAKHGEEE
jgi:hypothetical protein